MGELTFKNGSHEVTLQRLDVIMTNDGRKVRYSPGAFDPALWNGRPLIYYDVRDGVLRHPDQDLVNEALAGRASLPDGYSFVGGVEGAYIPGQGEPVLDASLAISDEGVNADAEAGKLSLSTSFSGETIREGSGLEALTGTVRPNHVLLFPRGICPNCFPNDNGARFYNAKEADMGDNPDGLVKAFKDFLTSSREEITAENAAELRKENEALKAENARIAGEVDKIREDLMKRDKDVKWSAFRNALPPGWLGDKEADTRKEFENDPGAFALKLIAHNAAHPPGNQPAQGNKNGTGTLDAENAAEAEVKKFEEETGFKFVD